MRSTHHAASFILIQVGRAIVQRIYRSSCTSRLDLLTSVSLESRAPDYDHFNLPCFPLTHKLKRKQALTISLLA